jgi:hypothetical protein
MVAGALATFSGVAKQLVQASVSNLSGLLTMAFNNHKIRHALNGPELPDIPFSSGITFFERYQKPIPNSNERTAKGYKSSCCYIGHRALPPIQ